jgi:PAS domain S-box-containing protein
MQKLRLLLVDDEREVGEFMRLRLIKEAPHFSVEFVLSAALCLEYIKASDVDCILSDYQMPGMNGVELLHALRDQGNDVPFIFVTGQGNEQVAAEAFREGADDYFTKEAGFAHFMRLVNSIEQAVKRRVSEAERKRALASLVESEKRFRSLVEYAADAFFLHDRDGRIRDVNRAACESLGYSREELLSMNVLEIEVGVGREQLEKFWDECAAGKTVSSEGVQRRSDGTTFPVDVQVGLIEVDGEALLLALARDITRRKQAERRAEQLNRVYRVLSNTNQLIIRTRERDTLFREACRIAVEDGGFIMSWIGLLDEEARLVVPVAHAGHESGYLDSITIPVSDEPIGRGPASTAIQTGNNFVCMDIESDATMAPWRERALARGYRSVAAFPLQAGGKVVGAYLVYSGTVGYFDSEEVTLLDELASDISYCLEFLEREDLRRQAEDALRESEAKFRSLVENSLVGVYIIQDGGFVYLNPRLASIFGYSREEFEKSVKLEDTIAPASRALVLGNIKKRLGKEVESMHYRFRGLKSDGSEFDVEVYGTVTEYGGRPAIIGTLLEAGRPETIG